MPVRLILLQTASVRMSPAWVSSIWVSSIWVFNLGHFNHVSAYRGTPRIEMHTSLLAGGADCARLHLPLSDCAPQMMLVSLQGRQPLIWW